MEKNIYNNWLEKCPNCGGALNTSDKYCPYCGGLLAEYNEKYEVSEEELIIAREKVHEARAEVKSSEEIVKQTQQQIKKAHRSRFKFGFKLMAIFFVVTAGTALITQGFEKAHDKKVESHIDTLTKQSVETIIINHTPENVETYEISCIDNDAQVKMSATLTFDADEIESYSSTTSYSLWLEPFEKFWSIDCKLDYSQYTEVVNVTDTIYTDDTKLKRAENFVCNGYVFETYYDDTYIHWLSELSPNVVLEIKGHIDYDEEVSEEHIRMLQDLLVDVKLDVNKV